MLILRSSRSQIFFKIRALKNFATFTGKHLCWPLQVFFYRTPTGAASRFLRQQILFFSWIWYILLTVARFLLRTPLKTRLKPKKQPLDLFSKKGAFRNFTNFTGKHLYWSLLLIELQEVCSFIKKDSGTDVFL